MKGKSRGTKGIGINGKLIGLLLPTIVIVFALILLLIYFSTSRIVLGKSEELLQSNSESVVNSVEAWMNRVITALDTERDTLEFLSMDRAAELDYIKHTAGRSRTESWTRLLPTPPGTSSARLRGIST